MKKGISIYILFIITIIAIGSVLYAAQEYIEYIVERGDTQWDIAEKTLKDPYDWPKVWVVNPEIKNPDLIYPGQKIRIPLSLAKESVKKAVTEKKPTGEKIKTSQFKEMKTLKASRTEDKEFYTVQIGSFPDIDTAEMAYNTANRMIEKDFLDYLRIEVVKGYHTVRIGRFERHNDANKLLSIVKRVFPGSIILKAYIKDERIKKIYEEAPEVVEKPTVEIPAPEEKEEAEKPPFQPSVKKEKLEIVGKTEEIVRTPEGLIPLKIPFSAVKERFEEKEKAELKRLEELEKGPKRERPPEPVTGKDELSEEGLIAFNVAVKEAVIKKPIGKRQEADIAIFPFENLSGNASAVERVTPVLREYLQKKGLRVLDEISVREFMTKSRFRERGIITKELSQMLGREYKVPYAMVGSITAYNDKGVPKFGLLGRIVNTSNGNIVWANFSSASGDDFIGLLGIGKITRIEKLIPVVVDSFVKPLSDDKLRAGINGRLRIAVLPFRNTTNMVGAGKIAAYMFIAELLRMSALQPVEYGDIRKEIISLKMREVGELSFKSIEGLSKTAGIDLILLGSVEMYEPAVSDAIPPKVHFTSKVIDANSKKLLFFDDVELDGNDKIKILDFGKLRSVDMVAHEAVKKMIKRMEEKIW